MCSSDLVYQPGEHVHGFTSVLNTLLPALPYWITGSFDATIWCFRLCSLALLAFGLAVLWRALHEKLGAGRFELWLGAILAATSIKIIAFSANGQETGLLVGFLALALGRALRLDEPRGWLWLGLAWAGLLYTRPDSPLLIAAVATISWQCGGAGAPGTRWSAVAKAGGVAAAAFLPWVVIAWSYYGSPVPHTITAKAGASVLVNNNIMATLSAMCAQIVEASIDVFGAIYGMGDWPQLLGLGAFVGGMFAALRWVRPGSDRFTALCSFTLFGLLVYFMWLKTQRDAYPWYYGQASLLAIVVVGRSAGTLWERRTTWARGVAVIGGGTLALVSAWIFVLGNQHAQRQQQCVLGRTFRRRQWAHHPRDFVDHGVGVPQFFSLGGLGSPLNGSWLQITSGSTSMAHRITERCASRNWCNTGCHCDKNCCSAGRALDSTSICARSTLATLGMPMGIAG